MSLLKRLRGLTATPPPSPPTEAAPMAPPRVLARVSAEAAREAHKHNPFSGWAARAVTANEADRSLACHRIWAGKPELQIRPKFQLSSDQPVFAMGSCFAREVEDALLAQGLDIPTHCDALFDDPLLQGKPGSDTGARPRAFLNRYNSMSMLDEFRHLLGGDAELESGLSTYPLDKGAVADLHYTQSLPQSNTANTLERRRLVREHQGAALRRSKLYVLTLGMAESWFDNQSGRYLNNTPGPRVLAAYGTQLEVHLTTFSQHLQALQELHALLSQVHGADFQVVITVSPVPLERTFLDADIVQTNTYSKSMLRAVAQEFAFAHSNVDYFPSYEMVSYADPTVSWAWDYRHVKPELVGHIMASFTSHYLSAGHTP